MNSKSLHLLNEKNQKEEKILVVEFLSTLLRQNNYVKWDVFFFANYVLLLIIAFYV